MSSRWISTSFSGSCAVACGGIDGRVRRLDQRRLAHAARAPEQHVVGGQAGGEALGVVEQDVAHAVDAADQADIDPVDAVHRLEARRRSAAQTKQSAGVRSRSAARARPARAADQPAISRSSFSASVSRVLSVISKPFGDVSRACGAVTRGVRRGKHACRGQLVRGCKQSFAATIFRRTFAGRLRLGPCTAGAFRCSCTPAYAQGTGAAGRRIMLDQRSCRLSSFS